MITGWDHEEFALLLERANGGDDAAFGTLYRKVAPMARRAAHRIVRDEHAADDLVQDAFYLVLHAVRSGHGPRESFPGYVLLTVKRLAYRYSGAQKRTIAVDDPDAWDQLFGRVATSAPDTDRIASAWASLPRHWRHIVWLIDVERYSPAELAPSMSMTANAVSSMVSRARRALRASYLASTHDA